MKLLETRNSSSKDTHEEVWELIPWYVNGSLSAEQKDMVRHHILSCPECVVEVARQHKLAKHVETADPFDVPLSQSWEKLRSQIESEKSTHREHGSVFSRRLGQFKSGLVILSGAAGIAACLAVAVLLTPTGNNLELRNTIKFQTEPGLKTEKIQNLLAQYGLELDSGPSQTEVYTTRPKNDADLAAVAKALMTRPEIVFAAPAQ